MNIQKESDLKKLVDTFGQMAKGKIEINGSEGCISSINKDHIEFLETFREGYRISKVNFSESNKYARPKDEKIIARFDPQFSSMNEFYQESFQPYNPFRKK